MTGFGRSEIVTDAYRLTIELKSVNHRYFDLNIKMPKLFNPFESSIRNLLRGSIQRGKVDLYITWENYSEDQFSLKYNRNLAGEYLKYFRMMRDEFGLTDDIKVSTLARFPDVFSMAEEPEDDEKIWEVLSEGLKTACAQFVSTRENEGENLKKDLLLKLDDMSALLASMEERAPEVLAAYRQKLEDKVKELLKDTGMEESRIAAEVTLYADKICIDEETVRLHSHIDAVKEELLHGDAVGRKLDFLAQEMNREANTALSKSSNLIISDKAIALKTEIEKIREQVQNIE